MTNQVRVELDRVEGIQDAEPIVAPSAVRRLAVFAMVLGLGLVVVACGGDATGDQPGTGTDTEGSADAAAPDDGDGAGGATLTIGDEVFTFDQVLCAVGTDETQSEDFDFVLDARQDGYQLQATTGTFGDEVSLDDIENFDNPRAGWYSDAAIERDGDRVSVQGDFVDSTAEDSGFSGETTPGTLEATCG